MHIRGWHIDGFGLLHDFRVDGLPNGLTVVLGPNEAGKTSLLGFIRGALFGYPDRRKKDRQYPPLRGGRHGGRLFVESGDSGWAVERFASPAQLTITQPDGSPGTEADLRRLLGGVDAELHRNAFAFSLSAERRRLRLRHVQFDNVGVRPAERPHCREAPVAADHALRRAVNHQWLDLPEARERRANCVEVALAMLAGVGGVEMKRVEWDARDDKLVQADLLCGAAGLGGGQLDGGRDRLDTESI